MKLKHIGLSPHRLKSNPVEAALSDAWLAENTVRTGHPNPVLAFLLCSSGDGKIARALTQEEATAAATAIQWIGSPVGQCFLRDALETAGYTIVPKGGGL